MRFTGAIVLVGLASAGCHGAKKYTTNVEVLDVEHFGATPEAATQVNFELRYAECPGDNRRILRGNRELARCTQGFKEGDKVPLEILSKWSSERGGYRAEITRIGNCAVKQDPKEEANYEMTSVCSDLETTGAVVGVHCDRGRPKALVDKCPFLRR